MISIIVLVSLMPAFILLIGVLLILEIKDRQNRKYLMFLIFGLALLINSVLFAFFLITGLVERSYFFNFETGSFLLSEIILIFGLMTTMFSIREVEYGVNEHYHDGILMLIFLCLIGLLTTSNLITIIAWFALLLLLIGVIFYFGDFPKQFQLLKYYFLGVSLSIIFLLFAGLLIYLEFQTINIVALKTIAISNGSNLLITMLLFFGFGIPCGLFPFSIYHLKNYFRDSSYTGLVIFSAFCLTSTFLLLRILNLFSFTLQINGVLFMMFSVFGLIISLVFVLTELFTSLDGNTYSLKKLFGFSLVADFNMLIFLSSYFSTLIKVDTMMINFYNSIIFMILVIFIVKMLYLYGFYPVMIKTQDDNLKLLGKFWEENKNFGSALIISGLILSAPFSLISLFSLLNIFSAEKITSVSIYSFMGFSIISVFVIYLAVILILISISFIQVYFSNEPRYLERDLKEGVEKTNNVHYLPILGFTAILIVLFILFVFVNLFYYNIFKSFLLIID